MRTPFVAAALLVCCATAVHAQSVRPLPATGELIRVTPPSGEPFVGTLAALGGDTMLLHTSPGDSAIRVVASRQTVEIHRRHRETWSAFGALIGFGLGLGAAQLVTANDAGSPHHADQLVVSGVAGAFVSGLIGFSVAPHRWQRITVTPPRSVPLPPPAQSTTTVKR